MDAMISTYKDRLCFGNILVEFESELETMPVKRYVKDDHFNSRWPIYTRDSSGILDYTNDRQNYQGSYFSIMAASFIINIIDKALLY
jgi:hypothetical protein